MEKEELTEKELLQKLVENTERIAQNTEPPGKGRQMADMTGLVVNICGALFIIEKLVQLIRRLV
jgi:hypothetical protein